MSYKTCLAKKIKNKDERQVPDRKQIFTTQISIKKMSFLALRSLK